MAAVTQDTCYQKPVLFQKVAGSDRVDQGGYQEISTGNTLVFVSDYALGLGTQTDYSLRVTVDGTLRTLSALSFGATTTWAQIATAVQAAIRALTSALETVSIVNGKLRVTSATNGPTSTISIADGSGGHPLLAAITALTTYGTVSINPAVAGREGVVYVQVAPDAPTLKDFYFIGFCRTSAGKSKSGLIYTYSKTTGMVTVADDADTTEIAVSDVITLLGSFA